MWLVEVYVGSLGIALIPIEVSTELRNRCCRRVCGDLVSDRNDKIFSSGHDQSGHPGIASSQSSPSNSSAMGTLIVITISILSLLNIICSSMTSTTDHHHPHPHLPDHRNRRHQHHQSGVCYDGCCPTDMNDSGRCRPGFRAKRPDSCELDGTGTLADVSTG